MYLWTRQDKGIFNRMENGIYRCNFNDEYQKGAFKHDVAYQWVLDYYNEKMNDNNKGLIFAHRHSNSDINDSSFQAIGTLVNNIEQYLGDDVDDILLILDIPDDLCITMDYYSFCDILHYSDEAPYCDNGEEEVERSITNTIHSIDNPEVYVNELNQTVFPYISMSNIIAMYKLNDTGDKLIEYRI